MLASPVGHLFNQSVRKWAPTQITISELDKTSVTAFIVSDLMWLLEAADLYVPLSQGSGQSSLSSHTKAAARESYQNHPILSMREFGLNGQTNLDPHGTR
jgi:hypothetical protein